MKHITTLAVIFPSKLNIIKRTHGFALHNHLTHATVVSNNLCPSLQLDQSLNACQPFDDLSDGDIVSVSAFLSRIAKQNRHKEVIYLFKKVLCSIIRPNQFTFGTVIHSALKIEALTTCKQLHACAMKMGLHSNVFVGSAVLDFYAKLSTIDEAQRAFEYVNNPNVVCYTSLISGYLKKGRFFDAKNMFSAMPERNVASWNAMISGCSQVGLNEEAVNLFIEMMREGFVPDELSFPCVISASANIAALGIGRSFHGCAVKHLGSLDLFVGNSLISFYAKCGSMEDALLVFHKLEERSIVSCNAVLCGFAQNGKGEDAIAFFEQMRSFRFKPNSVSYLGLLWACNHAGLVDQGYDHFNKVKLEDPQLLKPEHFACMVDLLSRCGRFREADRFLKDLPFDPGIGFWKALLCGCQIHSNFQMGSIAARKILALDPEDVSSYVMLSNAYSAAGNWCGVSFIRKEMKEKGLKRIPGCSWIEANNKVHVFVTADNSHEHNDEIYIILSIILNDLKEREISSICSVEFIDSIII